MAYEGNWREIPEFVDWFDKAEKWRQDFQVFEFIPANGDGEDESGRIAAIDNRLAWTLKSLDVDLIQPGVATGWWGSGGVEGWYIANKPWPEGYEITIEAMKIIPCNVCADGEISDPSDCENCEQEGTIWLRLEDTGWAV